jgi:hypothetical protein
MFYRLTAIDGCALPAPMTLDDTEHRVAERGLLLEPPSGAPSSPSEGRGVLKFFRSREDGSLEFLGSSSESYRWTGPAALDFSRARSTLGARFSGLVSGDQLELVAEPGGHFVRASTRLALTAAPTSPILAGWITPSISAPPGFSRSIPPDETTRLFEQRFRSLYAPPSPLAYEPLPSALRPRGAHPPNERCN